MKHTHFCVKYIIENDGNALFCTLEEPIRYFNRSFDGKWYHTYPQGNYFENDHLAGQQVIFDVYSQGRFYYADGNSEFEGKRPFLSFRDFQKNLTQKLKEEHPEMKQYEEMKAKILALPGGESYADPRASQDSWIYALDFDNATETIVGSAEWLGTRYNIIAVRYTHKYTGFLFINYCFRETNRPTGISYDLLLYDWD